MRSIWLAIVAVVAVAALVTSPATSSAVGKPQIFHFTVDETIPDEPGPDDDLCGIPVTTHVEGKGTDQIRVNKSGFPEFKGHFNGTVTWTSLETGLSVLNRVNSSFHDLSVTDNGDGTITVISATTGVPERLITPDGTTLLKDRGRVVFEAIIDYNDTPLDTSDDFFVTDRIVSVSGPHPDLESDFELFCPIITDALT
jgi:hypothetical protein